MRAIYLSIALSAVLWDVAAGQGNAQTCQAPDSGYLARWHARSEPGDEAQSGIIELRLGGPRPIALERLAESYAVTLVTETRTSAPTARPAALTLRAVDSVEARALAERVDYDHDRIVLLGILRMPYPRSRRVYEDSLIGYWARDQQLRLDNFTGSSFHVTHDAGDSLRGWWSIGDASVTPEAIEYFCARPTPR
jgi:hypothetical protein